MPIDQSEAIILRTTNFAEQDKIVVFFTRDKGVLRGVANGARKFGNRFGSSLEPMSVVKIFYYEKERKDLVTISQCDLLESFFDIQKDLPISCTLSYFAELIEEFSPSRSKDDLLYRLLLSVLRSLEENGDSGFLTRYFEAWFLKINGFLPDLRRCKKCRKTLDGPAWLSPRKDGAFCGPCAPEKKDEMPPGFGPFLNWIMTNPPAGSCPHPLESKDWSAIRRVFQTLITFHLEKEPRTLRFLQDRK